MENGREISNMLYLSVKALHLIGVITWFAALFYIFRLYVYHVENQNNASVVEVLQVMERRLYRAIMTPAMILTVAMGLSLLWQNPNLLKTPWFHAKLLSLVFLFAYHGFSGYVRKQFLAGNIFLTSKQCRLINEVPTIVLLVVVPLAVIKPF